MAMKQSIDDMKALLDRRGGIARGNRYQVLITHPYTPTKAINDPAEDHRHQVGRQRAYENSPQGRANKSDSPMANFIQGPEVTYMLCTGVTLPGKRISTTEATHDHNLAKKPYSMATDEVSMTFLLTGDYYIKKYFDMWMNMIIDSTANHYKTAYKSDYVADVEIRALQGNEDSIVGYGNLLENAYPIQMSAVELSNASDGLMELTITWEYDNWRALDIDKGFKSAGTEDKWTHPGERTSGQVPPMSGEETYNGPGARDSGTQGSGPRNEEVGVEVPRPGPRTSGQGAPFSGGYTPSRPGSRTSGVAAQEAYQSNKRGNMADYSAALAEAARKAREK
jgi:hypothetical protein